MDKAKPHLAILDIATHVMDGMEVLGRIMRMYRDVSVFLIIS